MVRSCLPCAFQQFHSIDFVECDATPVVWRSGRLQTAPARSPKTDNTTREAPLVCFVPDGADRTDGDTSHKQRRLADACQWLAVLSGKNKLQRSGLNLAVSRVPYAVQSDGLQNIGFGFRRRRILFSFLCVPAVQNGSDEPSDDLEFVGRVREVKSRLLQVNILKPP